jgi:hypothetical protein
MTSCTSSEKIMDALSLLDEDMAEEVGRLRGRRPKKPSFMRYGMIAAGFCVTLLCVLQLVPLMGRVPEDGVTGGGGQEDVSLENAGTNNSLTDTGLGSISPTVSESDEGSEGETAEDISASDESLGGGMEGIGDEKPSIKVRVDDFTDGVPLCTVVENVDTDIFPVGTNLFISFEKWKDADYQKIKPEDLTVGMEICVMFTGYDGDTIFAVMLYETEE